MANANNPHPDSTVYPDSDKQTDTTPTVRTTTNPAGSWPFPVATETDEETE